MQAPKGVRMKIQYKFATETVTIEVDDRWGELLVNLNRQEYNNDHKETRRHSSMDALAEQGVQPRCSRSRAAQICSARRSKR